MSDNNPEEVSTASDNQSTASIRSSWSWGAFMFDVPFLIAARKYAYLWFYLLFLIPIVNLFAILAIKIYLGIKGREIARTSKTFASEEEFLGFMKGFDWAGKVLFFVGLTVFVLGLIATFAFGAAVADFAPFEFYMNSTPQQ